MKEGLSENFFLDGGSITVVELISVVAEAEELVGGKMRCHKIDWFASRRYFEYAFGRCDDW